MRESTEHQSAPQPVEQVVFVGKIGEVVHITQPDGRIFEQFRRPPGTRLVIISPDNEIALTREFRQETGDYDLRLPGGKVCDTQKEYEQLRRSQTSMLEAAKAGATKEGQEELGLVIDDLELLTKANAGATVEWDLYYFLTRSYRSHEQGQQLEHGEDIEVIWMKPAEIRSAILAGQMREWRSAGVLLGLVLPELEQSND